MGLLVDGEWKDQWYESEDGEFQRERAVFRDWVRADGSTPYTPEAGRYHLFVAWACPWASRAIIFRKLKGLEDAIGMTVVAPLMLENGWEFREDVPEPFYDSDYLYELYLKASPEHTGRVTVPVLWDTEEETIVNNESSEIIRMFNSEFNEVAEAPELDFYPEPLREEIDAVNERVYETVNNGVYKAGFATAQDAYESAFEALFETLDWLEERLTTRRYLMGSRLTEADWRLFTTLVRFDPVYNVHFKCNRRRLVEYPNLWAYMLDLYQHPGVSETVVMPEIKEHYYGSHKNINPSGLIAAGPDLDLNAPHDRETLG